jgi:nucleoside 2-deoxyribosyltransferase
MQKVYLAGGFRTDWQNKLKELDGFIWLDPKEKERPNGVVIPMTVNEYGTWDLHFVKQSDIVFVYAERTNPSCIGLAVEMGYAKGIGKTIILVLEPNHETIKDNYLQFLKKGANITFETLKDGIDYLQSFKI